LVEDEKAWLGPAGKKYKWHVLNPNGTYGDYGEKDPEDNWDQHRAEPEKQAAVSTPKHEVALGYNYLNVDDGGHERLSIPLGVKFGYQYNISSRIGLGIDITYNTRKEDEIKQSWLFVSVGARYQFGNPYRIPDRVTPFVEAKAGVVQHKYKYVDPLYEGFKISDSFIEAALGGGIKIQTSKKIVISLKADWVPIWVDNRIEHNISFGADIDLLLRPKVRNESPLHDGIIF